MSGEQQIFGDYIKAEGLKTTPQRRLVLDAFLGTDTHVSVEEIYQRLSRGKRRVGFATVYRTMKLIADCGLAREVRFDDGVSRFEHSLGRRHHHHLVCSKCRQVIEFSSVEMDAIERAISRKYGFQLQSHRFEIFGICQDCRGGAGNK